MSEPEAPYFNKSEITDKEDVISILAKELYQQLLINAPLTEAPRVLKAVKILLINTVDKDITGLEKEHEAKTNILRELNNL